MNSYFQTKVLKALAIAPLFWVNAASAQYCTSGLYLTGCGEEHNIQSFSTSGGSTNISTPNSGCNTYSGFTYSAGQVHTTASAGTVSFSLTNTPYYTQTFKIWVDWNSDFDFADAGEEVYSATLGTGQTVTNNFAVPAGTSNGTKRMRVRCVGIPSTPVTACSVEDYGEIEDYNVAVGTAACPAPGNVVATVPSSSTVMLTWNAVSGASGYEYALTQSAAPPAAGTPIASSPYNASGLTASTLYYFHVRAMCSGGASQWSTISFSTPAPPPPCPAPANLAVSNITSSGAAVGWSAVSGAAGYHYVVNTSAQPSSTSGTQTTATSFTKTGLSANTSYYVHVRARCGPYTTSAWTSVPFKTKKKNGMNREAGGGLEVYPNPASNSIRIDLLTAPATNAVLTLTDMAGRVVLSKAVTGLRIELSVADVAPGIYMLQYMDDERREVVRVQRL